jgi:hypothetical protein
LSTTLLFRVGRLALLFATQATLLGAQQLTVAHVVDSNGRVLGPVADFVSPIVPLVFQDTVVPTLVFTTHLQASESLAVYFSALDCEGSAYAVLPTNSRGLHSPMGIVGTLNTVYLGARALPEHLPYASLLRPGSACENVSGFSSGLVPVERVADLTPPFVPPFSLRPGPIFEVPATGRTSAVVLALFLGGAASWALWRQRVAA